MVDLIGAVDRCSYPGIKFVLATDGVDDKGEVRFYVQVQHRVEGWHGAKHFVSHHMTEQEVVGLCFKAVMIATEYEVRKNFGFRPDGQDTPEPIYHNHLDPNALWQLCRDGKVQTRKEKGPP